VFFAASLVLEIDSDEEVDYASGVGCRREAEKRVLHRCILCAEENGGEVCFVEGVVGSLPGSELRFRDRIH